MSLKVDASFENGVFVPAHRPDLADRERVRLTIEPTATTRARAQAEGLSHVDGVIDHRSRTEHSLAIALDYHPDGC
jgi:predicted DNA-binding antitoxin AbrB/MazE fold protein